MSEYESWDLQENLSYWLKSRNKLKWIVNLDIDYFFTGDEENTIQLFSDEFVMKICSELKSAWEHIEILTIALSPEMCEGEQRRASSKIGDRTFRYSMDDR